MDRSRDVYQLLLMMTHSRIFDAAGKRNSALLSAAMGFVTTEIHIQIPVVWLLSPTAVVLREI